MRLQKVKTLSEHKKSNFFVSNKGSMQLSINAIVILVMAMAVLGIGLGLIRGVLGPAQNDLEDAIGKVDLAEVASSGKTIANIPTSTRMKSSRENELVVSFYNSGNANCDKNAAVRLDCGVHVLTKFNSVLSVSAPQGQPTTLLAILTPSSTADAPAGEGASGSQACKVEVICAEAKITVGTLANEDTGAVLPLNTISGSSAYIADSFSTFINFG